MVEMSDNSDIFEYNCLDCGECERFCSIYLSTGKYGARDKLRLIDKLREGTEDISEDEKSSIFKCTKCEACASNCPQEIDLIALYDWARAEVMHRYGPRNKKQDAIINNIRDFGNPFGETRTRLENMPEDLVGTENQKKDERSKQLLHLGCMLGYRLNSMRDDAMAILNLLKVDYSVSEKEKCCGYFLWNTGERKVVLDVIEQNQSLFKNYERIICACAGCYTFFKNNYPNPAKFIHIVEVIDEELGKIDKSTRETLRNAYNPDKDVSFHDSCHLTRPHRIIEPPRNILRLMGYHVKEFEMSKENGVCCGADGGMRITNLDLAVQIGKDRVDEAKIISDELITLCPFCIFNFKEASQGDFPIESLYNSIVDFLNPLKESNPSSD